MQPRYARHQCSLKANREVKKESYNLTSAAMSVLQGDKIIRA